MTLGMMLSSASTITDVVAPIFTFTFILPDTLMDVNTATFLVSLIIFPLPVIPLRQDAIKTMEKMINKYFMLDGFDGKNK